MTSFTQNLGLLYSLYWLAALAGLLLVRSGTSVGRRLEVYTWNSRVHLWHSLPQFRAFFSTMHEKKYLRGALLVTVFNLPMVFIQCMAGLILLSPLIAALSGGFAGIIIGQGKRKRFLLYAASTATFEFGAFASAGAVGMTVGLLWTLSGAGFMESVAIVAEGVGLLALLPFFCLALNGLIESAGPCFWNIDGIPGIEAYRNYTLKGN